MKRLAKLAGIATLIYASILVFPLGKSAGPVAPVVYAAGDDNGNLDSDLQAVLSAAGFTGRIQ